jgi:hypothetical protein
MADDITTTTDAGDGGTGQPSADDAGKPKAKTFTQAEVDAIANKAKMQARKEFADYNDLKTKADEFDKLQESTRSNEDKLRTAHDRAVRERDEALTRSRNTLIRGSIISAASRLGVVDPEAVAALLPKDELIVEGEEVLGVEEAVKALLVKKPYLRQAGSPRGGNEINGGGTEPVVYTRSQIRLWLKSGQMTADRQKAVEEAAKAGRVLDR